MKPIETFTIGGETMVALKSLTPHARKAIKIIGRKRLVRLPGRFMVRGDPTSTVTLAMVEHLDDAGLCERRTEFGYETVRLTRLGHDTLKQLEMAFETS